MKKQHGFGAIETLLILLLVSFIGFAGYYVWNSQQDKDDKTTSTNTSHNTESTSTVSADETASWLSYESPDKVASIKLPDGYGFEKSENGYFVMALEEEMAYKKGTKATLSELLGRDAVLGLFISFDAQSNMSTDVKETGSFKTTSGVTVTEYYQLYTEDSEGIGPSKGTKEYTFIAEVKDRHMSVTYVSMSADQLETVRKMVKTISIP